MGTVFHLYNWFIDWLGYTGALPPLEKGTEEASRKRQLHHNPVLSQWHFIVVFCQFRQKPGFFMQNVSQKGLQRPFWLSLQQLVVPSPSFFSTSRPAREKRFAPSATSALVLPFHQIPSFYDICRRNERGESGTLVSAHLSIGWIVVQPSISPLVHKRKSLKTARKTC